MSFWGFASAHPGAACLMAFFSMIAITSGLESIMKAIGRRCGRR